MFVDTHCHLNYPEFSDLDAVLQRAADQGVKGFVTINCRLDEIPAIQKIANHHPSIFASVGIHPNDISNHLKELSFDEIQSILEKALTHSKVVGIGETGLDYYYENSKKDDQKKSFEMHIDFAIRHDIPVIIHTRSAQEDTLDILSNFPNVKGIFHCFSENKYFLKRALDIGFYVSFSGIVTFQKSTDIQESVIYCPMDRLLIETDSPYLAPVPHRGKKNEPAFVYHVAQKISDLKNMSLDNIGHHTTHNAQKVFNVSFF
jgi:TatD DNase family protein